MVLIELIRWFSVIGPVIVILGSIVLGLGVKFNLNDAMIIPGLCVMVVGAVVFCVGLFVTFGG